MLPEKSFEVPIWCTYFTKLDLINKDTVVLNKIQLVHNPWIIFLNEIKSTHYKNKVEKEKQN